MVDLPLTPLPFAPVERVGVSVGEPAGGRSAKLLPDRRLARPSAGERCLPSRDARGVTSAEPERLRLGFAEILLVAMTGAAPFAASSHLPRAHPSVHAPSRASQAP